MLQISSGKFFSKDIEHSNQLRGTIYTNLTNLYHPSIETAAGTLTVTDDSFGLNAFLYEFVEYMEPSSPAAGLIISHGIGSLILDFSSILSFALNCVASPSYIFIDRLVSDQPGVTTSYTPNQMVKYVFDKKTTRSKEEVDFFIKFTEQLIGLERKTYLSVMRSIRTYVTAMQRIADDYELAYTLLVASLESLAQNFDGHKATWEDYSQEKRKIIDNALINADDLTANKVREALLDIEHTSLNKRFREFTIKYVSPEFYREKAIDTISPISKFDMPFALKNAYQARSSYVHNLKKLPYQLSRPTHYIETCIVDNKPWLTLQGLSRLAKEVIINFIMKQNTVSSEVYNYQLEIPNIIMVQLDPSHWIANNNFSEGSGRKKLQGFLTQLSDCMVKKSNASVTDLTEVLNELERKIPSLKKQEKISFTALYILYKAFTKKSDSLKTEEMEFIKNNERYIFESPSEFLIVYNLLGMLEHIEAEKLHENLSEYLDTRNNKNKVKLPVFFETRIFLQIAELYRKKGNHQCTLDMIAQAIENYPGCKPLLKLEQEYKSQPREIQWKTLLNT